MPVPPEIMNRIRAESGVGNTVEHTHHKPGVRAEAPEETENRETDTPALKRLGRLLGAAGLRQTESES